MDADGPPFLMAGSPHAYGRRRHLLHEALRRDLSVFRIEKAPRTARRVPRDAPYPQPEACTPYLDATGMGFLLKPRLPLLFVRTRRGDLLPDARTALAFAREHERDFADVLAVVEERAAEVLDPQVVARSERHEPHLFRDLVQPYSLFAEGVLDIPLGLYVVTPPGLGTVIGPPVNRPARLPVQTGLIETDWHQKGLFIVSLAPEFDGQSLLIVPEQEVAQLYFAPYRLAESTVVEQAVQYPGGEDAYPKFWRDLSNRLVAEGRGRSATLTGVASVGLECLHCRVSVTRAAEGELPTEHVRKTAFGTAYKLLKRQRRTESEERP